ncbi:hypothetical protein [Herbiconiux sp.]|uniref:hypothetical protein n=1 Tax=Herbiconiux sp. TaxID=1871186 RepID=UPI0025BFE61D|nr:hypothetical protein [Herbiconiux sp.]
MIAEPDESGHRLYYVAILAEGALSEGYDVTIALSGVNSEKVDAHLSGVRSKVDMTVLPGRSLSSIEKISKIVRPTKTVIPDGDRAAYRIGFRGWQGYGDVSVLVMRDPKMGANRGTKRVKKSVQRLLLEIASHRARVTVRILRAATSSSVDEKYTRDPVTLRANNDEVAAITKSWGISKSRYWFAVLGAVTTRKNVALVARALNRVDNVGLVIAGRIQREALEDALPSLEDLKKGGNLVLVRDELLSDTELDALVLAVDCVVLAHSNEGPSGLMGKAAAAGTRVVASGAQSLMDDVSQIPTLAEWVNLDEYELAEAFRRAAISKRPGPVITVGAADFVKSLL